MHRILKFFYSKQARSFENSLANVEATQRQRLRDILSHNSRSPWGKSKKLNEINSYESFCASLPVTDHSDWRELIHQDRFYGRSQLNKKTVRYEPTSGSTGDRKWIPYTQTSLLEMNRAAQAWIYDLYCSFPEISQGKHYWSLSWVPDELRKELNSNDLSLFPWWQAPILKRFMVLHPALQNAPSSASAWWVTKLLLSSCMDLSLISVWSPTYALNLIHEIYRDRAEIARALKTKAWVHFETELRSHSPLERLDFPEQETDMQIFIQKLWPQLALVSCWDSGPSNALALELGALLPMVRIQGKGLWATEGVVTIPWRDQFPMALTSHFYEFKCLTTEKILPAWKLQLNQEVQPLLSSSNGILRSLLSDHLRVSGFLGNTPCFEFLGRLEGVDLVGEKVSYAKASELIQLLNHRFPSTKIVCFGARFEKSSARYSLIGLGTKEDYTVVQSAAEEMLMSLHHYQVARQLNQLTSVQAHPFADLVSLSEFIQNNQIKGNSKINSIIRI